jgi:hypothetical protein
MDITGMELRGYSSFLLNCPCLKPWVVHGKVDVKSVILILVSRVHGLLLMCNLAF